MEVRNNIFNASLEKSVNLVSDKYILNSVEDINKKGYFRKIIGSITIILFMWAFHFAFAFLEKKGANFLSISPTLLSKLLILLAIICLFHYFFEIFKLRKFRILSFYFYNKKIFFLIFCLYLQCLLIAVMGSGMIIGYFFSSMLFSLIMIGILIERVLWFKNNTYASLYHNKSFKNKLNDFLEKFVIFSKKFGGIVVFCVVIFRFFYTIDYHSDTLRSLGILGYTILLSFSLYFVISLGADNIKGYYLKKYLEDYRQLSGYSIEEWYGKKSKMYKDSLKTNR
ncbi:hypothetical protein GKS17_01415 [Streptococcus uberis]|uniref:hypothetical protein n=1 Tax=Streptococcus uberis TaxID=1349 RepID=UPI0012B5A2D9|nr:hypothetical protein [Streptococcus uberis]MTC89758.1 hypothetical protein [Streptococcus uberis]MTC95457.1 hypothetical protein [Streptococcus uberis]